MGENDTTKCFYEPLRSEGGMARRYCSSHLNGLYNGEECVTNGTFQLRELSRVSHCFLCNNSNFTTSMILLQKNITAEVAAFVLQLVATVVDDFDENEQREDNLNIVADIYGNIGDLVAMQEFNATEEVSPIIKCDNLLKVKAM